MLTGKSFRLKVETLGGESLKGNQQVVHVPAGSVVKIETGPTEYDPNTVEVLWAGRTLTMFVEDVQGRGESVAAV